jgi:flagellar motor protein MotB
MESLRARVWLVLGLMGVALVGQGCVPWSKFIKIKKENERLLADLAEKDRLLGDEASRLQALRDQLNAANQLIDLFKQKYKDAEALAAKSRSEFDELQRRLDKFAADRGLESGPRRLMLKDTLLFALGSADISEQGRKVLADLAREFKDQKDLVLQVDGHTDDHRVAKPETVQRFGCNWGLSAARATAVIRVLAKDGFAERNLQGGFYSMWRPRAMPVTDETNRSKNRRVEILFLPGGSGGPAIQPGPPDTEPAPAPEKAPEPPKAEPAKAEPAKAPAPANPEPKKE